MHRRGAVSLARLLTRWSSKAAAASEQGAATGLPHATHVSCLTVISRYLLPVIHGGAGQALPFLGSPAAAFSSSATPPPPPAPHSEDASVITIGTLEDFKAVLSLSQQAPVVVDMWATWCGPCKQLEPVLKAAVAATDGAVKLAKLDIDTPALAPLVQQMQVTSVPTMVLLLGGRMLDVKVGVPPKEELRSWIEEAIILAEEQLGRPLGAGQQRQAGAPDPKHLLEAGFAALDEPGVQAADVAPFFGDVLQEEAGANSADKARALAGLAMCALIDNPPNLDTARNLVNNAKEVAPAADMPDEVPRAQALVELAAEAAEAEIDSRTPDELQQAVEANPRDLEARYTLAMRQFAAGQHQAAIDSALGVVRVDRQWREQAGKRLLLRFFDALGADSDLAKSGRRRLSSLWFM